MTSDHVQGRGTVAAALHDTDEDDLMTLTAHRRWSTIVGTSFALTVLATAALVLASVTGAHVPAGWIAVPIAAHVVLVVLGVIILGVWTFLSAFIRRVTHNLRNQ